MVFERCFLLLQGILIERNACRKTNVGKVRDSEQCLFACVATVGVFCEPFE